MALVIYSWGGSLGTALSLALGGVALDYFRQPEAAAFIQHFSLAPWQATFILLSAPGFILAPLMLILPEPERSQKLVAGSFMNAFRRKRAFVSLMFLTFGLTLTSVYVIISWAAQYMIRSFGMTPSAAGVQFGFVVIAAPVLGGLLSANLVDWLFGRRIENAHMLVTMWLCVIALPLVVLGFVSGDRLLVWVGIVAMFVLITPLISVASAALQLVTPVASRGIMSGAFLAFISVLSTTVGPSIVGVITDLVLHDPSKLGLAIAMTSGGALSLAIPLAFFGARTMPTALERTDAGAASPI